MVFLLFKRFPKNAIFFSFSYFCRFIVHSMIIIATLCSNLQNEERERERMQLMKLIGISHNPWLILFPARVRRAAQDISIWIIPVVDIMMCWRIGCTLMWWTTGYVSRRRRGDEDGGKRVETGEEGFQIERILATIEPAVESVLILFNIFSSFFIPHKSNSLSK